MPRSPSHRSRRDISQSPDRYRSRDDRKKRSSRRSQSPDERHRRTKEKKHKKSKRDRRESIDGDEPPSPSRLSLDTLGYSNVNNPYNDINLESKFVWSKKKDKDRKRLGLDDEALRRREQQRRRDTDDELAKIQKRREEREIERRLRDEELTKKRREDELAQLGDWEKKEEMFHLDQAKQRAEKRVKTGRAKPIDVLAVNLCAAYEPEKLEEHIDLDIAVDAPYTMFTNLSLEETNEICEQIEEFLRYEENDKLYQFWSSLRIIAEDYHNKLEKAKSRGATSGVSAAVNEDIERILTNKTPEQLAKLRHQIESKLSSNQPIDVEYWENLRQEVGIQIQKLHLDNMHQDILKILLENLRNHQREKGEKVQQEVARMPSMQWTQTNDDVQTTNQENEQKVLLQFEPYDRSMSPEPFLQVDQDDKDLPIIDSIDDLQQLMELRNKVLGSKVIPMKPQPKQESIEEEPMQESTADVVLYKMEEAKGCDEDQGEEWLKSEAELSKQAYKWQDIYRPRKPRYVNRVHTGYEWNKYNQTHYDQDNPPPKVVQGYKFNIFYSDLIDKSITPTYFIDRDESSEHDVIRFTAGPPYEDIAFRIVKREWEYSHKKGFECKFERGVLSLFFQFKREFYRK